MELLIIGDNYFKNNSKLIESANIGSIYISVDKKTISYIRESLIKINYTTRIFVARIGDKVNFYVYGKKKSNKGVFNQHCKNTVYEYSNDDELYKHLIESSSNKGDLIISDNKNIRKSADVLNRKLGELIE